MEDKTTREQLLLWKERWRRVSERIAELDARESPELRLKKLEAARLTALALGWDRDLHSEDELVRDRWKRLRQAWVKKHGSNSAAH